MERNWYYYCELKKSMSLLSFILAVTVNEVYKEKENDEGKEIGIIAVNLRNQSHYYSSSLQFILSMKFTKKRKMKKGKKLVLLCELKKSVSRLFFILAVTVNEVYEEEENEEEKEIGINYCNNFRLHCHKYFLLLQFLLMNLITLYERRKVLKENMLKRKKMVLLLLFF